MASSLTVREIPDDALAELKARAARKGQSLQEYMRLHIVDMTKRPDIDELMDRARARVERIGREYTAEEIVRLRDMDRR